MSKSRQEKTRTPAQTAPPPPVSNDIVPGRFTDSDWHQMIETEDGEDFICDIVQEIVDSTMAVLHDRYIQSQTLPYTVQETKKLLLEIIEWQFLACDGGEENPAVDPTWLEEDEPIAPVTDSWAQGSVPVVLERSASAASSTGTSVISEANSEDSCIEEDRPGAPEPPFQQLELSETPLSIGSPAQPSTQDTPQTEIIQPKPPSSRKPGAVKQKKRTVPFKPHRGRLPAFPGVDLTSVTDVHVVRGLNDQGPPPLDENGMTLLSSSTSILKAGSLSYCSGNSWKYDPNDYNGCVSSTGSSQTQHGRPPGNKDVVYDEKGNVKAVIRINPDKLPSHRIRTKFAVVDQESEAVQLRSRSKKPTIQKYTFPRKDLTKSLKTGKGTGGSSEAGTTVAVNEGIIYTQSTAITPLPPPLVDSMDVNAGVVVREGDVVRRGPVQAPRKIDRRTSPLQLQPLDTTSSARGIPELVTRSSPIIKPLYLSEPIPPILSQPPTQSA